MTKKRYKWPPIVQHAADIVRSYDTGVTLRQLFYRLVSDGSLPNTTGAYKTLSDRTADARRRGIFPGLVDHGRSIHVDASFDGPEDALNYLARVYRRDRTEGQDVSLYIGVEKAGFVAQLHSWFGDLGVPIVALGGYASQSYVDEVSADVRRRDRCAVLLYAGDFDPSGQDIDRDFVERTGVFDKVIRVALRAGRRVRFSHQCWASRRTREQRLSFGGMVRSCRSNSTPSTRSTSRPCTGHGSMSSWTCPHTNAPSHLKLKT